MLRRSALPLILALAGLDLLVTAAPAAPVASARAQGESIGIRLVDAPTSRSDDPRAKSYIVDHLAPGTTIQRRVEVSNDTATTQAIQIYAGSASVTDGNFQFGEGRTANELTGWVTVDPAAMELGAGSKGLATVTIAVPRNASAGEVYGVVWAEVAATPPAAGGGLSAVNRVGVRIYLSIGSGGEPPSDFTITTLEARRDAEGNPVVAANVRNTGGRALDLSGELTLTNGPGGLSAGPFNARLGTTLGVGDTEPALVMLDRAIPLGPWDARIALRSGSTEREATATITFPAEPATAAKPVPAKGDGSGGKVFLLLVAAAAIILVAGAATTLIIRRRR